MGRKKDEQQTLKQRIEAFNQALYKAIEAHSGNNMPNSERAIRQAHTELDKILRRHTDELEALPPEDQMEYHLGTEKGRDDLRELFAQINNNQRALREKPAPSNAEQATNKTQGITSPSSSPQTRRPLPQKLTTPKKVMTSERTKDEKQAKEEKTKVAHQAFDDFNQILKTANKLASGEASPRDMRNLDASFQKFKGSPVFESLESIDKENIHKQFAQKKQAIVHNKLNPILKNKAVSQEEKMLVHLPQKASDILEQAKKVAAEGGTPKEINGLLNAYHELTTSKSFTEASQAAKDQFAKSFENSVREMSKPFERSATEPESKRQQQTAVVIAAESRKGSLPTIGAGRQKSATASADPSDLSPSADAATTRKPLPTPPAFKKAMDERNKATNPASSPAQTRKPPTAFQEAADAKKATTTRQSRSGSFKGA